MIHMPIPEELKEVLETFESLTDRRERSEMLIYYADKFQEVPPEVAQRPFSEEHRVPYCDSQAFVWAVPQNNDTLKFYFAVENPQGISAKALSVLLDKYASDKPVKEVAEISPEIVYTIFGHDLGMVRAEGLRGIVKFIAAFAKQYLQKTKNAQI